MLKVLQIVRRFGPVGGMERYVWELSHALADSGIETHILCEESSLTKKHENIQIHLLDRAHPKPRWWSMLKFSFRVQQWLDNNTYNEFVIHSHERTSVHHVTTFHGNLFAHVRKKPWWKKMSIRIAVWLYLEKRELCGENVQVILPNSDLIHDELKTLYPCIDKHLFAPAYPGCHPKSRSNSPKVDTENEVIIFIGQEWRRKGLEKAIQIIEKIKHTKSTVDFWVLGPDPKEIQHLFDHWQDGYRLLGWQDSAPYLEQANLLLHPALAEPYGMAIAEATNVGIPVVISDKCGIANLVSNESGQVISNEATIQKWVSACIEELSRSSPVKDISHTWQELAKQHIQIYSQVIFK